MSDDPVLVEKAAKEAWALGLITEEDVDRALRNMFGTRLKLEFMIVCRPILTTR